MYFYYTDNIIMQKMVVLFGDEDKVNNAIQKLAQGEDDFRYVRLTPYNINI